MIGLTGGIASGKSTIARRLAEHGAVHVDADQLAREVVERGTEALRQIEATFGDRLIAADGSLDRAALGSIVFADRDSLAALNGIVHPAVRRLSAERIADAGRRDRDAVVVYDVPLLVEAAVDHPFDLIVVAHASEEVRAARLVELRGLSAEEARRRVAAQASDAERLAIADRVIDAGGSLADTLAQTDALWRSLRPSPPRDGHTVSGPA